MTLAVGRLAPSPTGAQHVGNARTYLVAWLSARAQGGAVRVRVEDIDSPRVKPGAAEQALDDLRWLGLDWDGEVVVQSARRAHHAAALDALKGRELIYPCTCTRADVATAAGAPHDTRRGLQGEPAGGSPSHGGGLQGEPAGGSPSPAEEVTYPGTCAHRRAADAARLAAEGRPFAWRFRVSDSPPFADRFAGDVRVDLTRVGGDFVVWKNTRAPNARRGLQGEPAGGSPSQTDTPAYQLAVVVDDAAGGVTEVVRGDDLIPSTPRQLLLYRALGLTAPAFAHVPLVVGEDGRRLAKRHGDTRLSALRAAGVTAEALVGLLAWSCGWAPRPDPIAARDLLPRFDLGAIPPRPFVLTAESLRAIGYAG